MPPCAASPLARMFADIDWNPAPRTVRRWAIVTAAILAAMGALWRWCVGEGGILPASVAGALVAAAAIGPPALRPLYRAWMSVAWILATATGVFSLAAIYFFVVTPLGLACRLAGRDPLQLARPSGSTLWRRIDAPADDPQRQF